MSNWHHPSIGLANDLAPNRRQAIIWTNANPLTHICGTRGRSANILHDVIVHPCTNIKAIITWTRNYIQPFYVDVITRPCPNLNVAISVVKVDFHGWPSTQPGTCTQPCPLFTQPCPGRTMSTAVCIYVAGLCASCVEGHLCRGSPVISWNFLELLNFVPGSKQVSMRSISETPLAPAILVPIQTYDTATVPQSVNIIIYTNTYLSLGYFSQTGTWSIFVPFSSVWFKQPYHQQPWRHNLTTR